MRLLPGQRRGHVALPLISACARRCPLTLPSPADLPAAAARGGKPTRDPTGAALDHERAGADHCLGLRSDHAQAIVGR